MVGWLVGWFVGPLVRWFVGSLAFVRDGVFVAVVGSSVVLVVEPCLVAVLIVWFPGAGSLDAIDENVAADNLAYCNA